MRNYITQIEFVDEQCSNRDLENIREKLNLLDKLKNTHTFILLF